MDMLRGFPTTGCMFCRVFWVLVLLRANQQFRNTEGQNWYVSFKWRRVSLLGPPVRCILFENQLRVFTLNLFN